MAEMGSLYLSEEDLRLFLDDPLEKETANAKERMECITGLLLCSEQTLKNVGFTSKDIYDLHSAKCLTPLISYLRNHNNSIRAKAADVVATMVSNKPNSQRLVMEANGLDALLCNISSDHPAAVRTRALEAISSLIRDNIPGIKAFQMAKGYATLKDALEGSYSLKLQRLVQLVHYLLLEDDSDSKVVSKLGFPCMMMHLASSIHRGVREAALWGLIVLARSRTESNDTLAEVGEELRQILEVRIEKISKIASHAEAVEEEMYLLDLLWMTCYNEPSSLREKGLLVVS